MPRISTGEQFPNLTFETYSGKTMQVSQAVKGKKYTIFWVMRYIGCRICQYDVDSLAENYSRFTARDTQAFAVIQSRRETVTRLKGDFQVPFEIICDPQHTFYKALDVKATATKEDRMPRDDFGKAKLAARMRAVEAKHYGKISGDGEELQQLPALFIVDETGKVVYAHYAVYTVDIPEIDEMLNLLENECR